MIFFISPYFLMIFQVGGGGGGAERTNRHAILKKPIKNCQKIGGEGIQKELSDNDVVDIYIHFCHATIFPALFWVITIYFWFNQLKLNFMCHTKTVFSSHFFRFIAWLSECMKNVDVLIYYMMYYKWIFAMYILYKISKNKTKTYHVTLFGSTLHLLWKISKQNPFIKRIM